MVVESQGPNRTDHPIHKVETLKRNLLSYATGGEFEGGDPEYRRLRREIREYQAVYARLPECVRTCTSLAEFWTFTKQNFSTYQERRTFLWEAFKDVVAFIEENDRQIPLVEIGSVLSGLDIDTISDVWSKMLSRRSQDPAGAITAARTLLESVCKHILDDDQVSYGNHDDLPKLWRHVAEHLNLTPEQHSAPDIRSLLGQCQAVVGGLANLRNSFGDAHGQGRNAMRPLPRHAALAVNLAGSMASFLIETWLDRKQKPSESAQQ